MAITVYTYNDKVLKNVATDKWLKKKLVLPPIPSNTVRVRTNDGNAPVRGAKSSYQTATLVTGTTDVYDVYESGTNIYGFLDGATNIIEILGINTPSVTQMAYMFSGCTALTSIPLFDTSNVIAASYMFSGCINVESGALALYQQMSTQTTPPTYYTNCFTNCGSNTVTGAAELTQIPSDWGGTGA